MARYDASTAEVLIFTFKEGLLSPMAHDLKLKVGRFTVERDGDAASVELDAASLKVVCAMKDGQESPSALGALFHGEIEKNLERDVLKPARHPKVTFKTTQVTATEVVGSLTLCGQTRTVRGARRDEGGRIKAEFRLDQRDFGIKPFSAALGTLKVKPEVLVRVSLPQA